MCCSWHGPGYIRGMFREHYYTTPKKFLLGFFFSGYTGTSRAGFAVDHPQGASVCRLLQVPWKAPPGAKSLVYLRQKHSYCAFNEHCLCDVCLQGVQCAGAGRTAVLGPPGRAGEQAR